VEDRVYHIGVWRGLDAKARELFDMVEFQKPTRSVESVDVPTKAAFLKEHGMPEKGQELKLNFSRTGGERLEAAKLWDAEALKAASTASKEGDNKAKTSSSAGGCVAQPYGLRFQTQWLNDTDYYGGSPGWSRLVSYRNRGRSPYHYGCNWGARQYYAMDFTLSYGALLYSGIPGRVTWAGASNDSYRSLGIFVDVVTYVNGTRYVNRSAHLSRLFVTEGNYISLANLPYIEIGRVGLTGTTATPHLHTALFAYPGLDRYGRAYYGTSVRPRSMRCYACTNYEVNASGSGGYYTSIYLHRYFKY
jgi:murein DD-endopeptidase MepM/ murein hydrolase activator NlpD